MNNDTPIKQANRKALPKYILVMVISTFLGAGIGFFSVLYSHSLDAFSDDIKSAGNFFSMHIAPWLMLAVAVVIPIACVPPYKRAKKLLAAWNGENEEVSGAAEHKLSIVIWISEAALIVSLFLIAASYSGGTMIFENKKNIVPFFVSIAAFFAIIFEAGILQQKCIDAAKKTNPEKTASFYDFKFQKKWLDNCDEAEKIIIGKCTFKAYLATNITCTILAVSLALCALVFDIGFLPSFAVCMIWIVNQSVYCKEALKYTKTGYKIL